MNDNLHCVKFYKKNGKLERITAFGPRLLKEHAIEWLRNEEPTEEDLPMPRAQWSGAPLDIIHAIVNVEYDPNYGLVDSYLFVASRSFVISKELTHKELIESFSDFYVDSVLEAI